METKDIALIQAQLKRNRLQSYLFLTLLLIGAGLTAFAFYKLHLANHEIEVQNRQLETQKSQLKEKANELKTLNTNLVQLQSSNQGYSQKDSLIREINSLVSKSNAHVNLQDLATLSLPELQGRVDEIHKQIDAYNETRRGLIKDLYSNNESKRKKSRIKLEKEYSVDENLVSDLLSEMKGKVDVKNKDSYYQIIYLLGQLDSDLLKTEAEGLNNVFTAGKNAGLHGSSTQGNINRLKYKIK